MYDRILIPTDGSAYAEIAAQRGFDLAESFESAVYLISVVDTGPFGSFKLPGESTSPAEAFTNRAQEFVSRLKKLACDRGLSVRTEIQAGAPVQSIIDYSAEIDADVIVIASRGRGGFSKMMLGSVTEGVTRYSDTDVLVVNADSEAVNNTH